MLSMLTSPVMHGVYKRILGYVRPRLKSAGPLDFEDWVFGGLEESSSVGAWTAGYPLPFIRGAICDLSFSCRTLRGLCSHEVGRSVDVNPDVAHSVFPHAWLIRGRHCCSYTTSDYTK